MSVLTSYEKISSLREPFSLLGNRVSWRAAVNRETICGISGVARHHSPALLALSVIVYARSKGSVGASMLAPICMMRCKGVIARGLRANDT